MGGACPASSTVPGSASSASARSYTTGSTRPRPGRTPCRTRPARRSRWTARWSVPNDGTDPADPRPRVAPCPCGQLPVQRRHVPTQLGKPGPQLVRDREGVASRGLFHTARLPGLGQPPPHRAHRHPSRLGRDPRVHRRQLPRLIQHEQTTHHHPPYQRPLPRPGHQRFPTGHGNRRNLPRTTGRRGHGIGGHGHQPTGPPGRCAQEWASSCQPPTSRGRRKPHTATATWSTYGSQDSDTITQKPSPAIPHPQTARCRTTR